MQKDMTAGMITSIQKYCLQDGPGIRTTVFFKGCPLKCEWCHNPETQSEAPELFMIENRCIQCFACIADCPEGAIQRDNQGFVEISDICTLCGICVDACPTGALDMVGREMSVDEVMGQVIRDAPFYDESRGGVTFSGGEPLHQAEFLLALLKACRAMDIHTAVDTCGFGPGEPLLAVASHTDLILYDLKLINGADHLKRIGVSNDDILNNLKALSRTHHRIWIRIPIIPGINDSIESLEAMARFIEPLSGIEQINLLPYHRTGMQKLKRLGRAVIKRDIPPPGEPDMLPLLEPFKTLGMKAILGG
jgi:pyruvate formate lyase activating enzyme